MRFEIQALCRANGGTVEMRGQPDPEAAQERVQDSSNVLHQILEKLYQDALCHRYILAINSWRGSGAVDAQEVARRFSQDIEKLQRIQRLAGSGDRPLLTLENVQEARNFLVRTSEAAQRY